MNLMSFSIITRYNVKSPFAEDDFDVNNPTWLAHRRLLFEENCAPSVRRQTDQNFDWYMLVDSDLPAEEADRLSRIGGCKIVRCSSQSDGVEKLRPLMRKNVVFALSARLDSDDSLAPTYVETMRDYALRSIPQITKDGHGAVFCFANGTEHDKESDQWFDRYYMNNPFIGLLEPITDNREPVGVFQHAHYDMCRHYDTLLIRTKDPMWCIRVHGGNVANTVKGTARESQPSVFYLDR